MFPNFMRIFLLLTEIAVNVVRTFLQKEFQPEDLETFIEKNKTLIYHLHHNRRDGCCMCFDLPRQQIIRDLQFKMLFVSNGQNCKKFAKKCCHCQFKANPNIELKDIDLTLIISLLNNCLTLDPQKNRYLTVIRKSRNEISHCTHENDYDDCHFSTMWGDISTATEYLAKCISEEYSKEILDKIRQLKKRTLLPVEYTNAVLEILRWKGNNDENTTKIMKVIKRMKSKIGSRDKRIESMLCSIKRRLNAAERQQSTQNCDTVDKITMGKNKCTTGSPDVTISPAEQNVIHGNNLTREYTVTGNPSAASTNKRFSPNRGTQRSSNISGCDEKESGGSTQTTSQTVTSPQTADVDSNVCCSSNAVEISSGVPKVQILQSYYTKPCGDQVVIQCRIESVSCVTDVYWEKFSNNSSEKITRDENGYHGRTFTTTSPSLTIDHVTKNDAGTYICHATNASGKGTSKSATLILNGDLSSTQNPSLTVTNFQLSDAGSYVSCASNDFGTASCNRPSVLKFGGSGSDYDETYRVIDGMRLGEKKCRKTELLYSVLVYTALRGSFPLEQEDSNILREIVKAINPDEDGSVILERKFLEMKLVPHFLKKTENLTYEPKNQVVKKSIINLFAKECKECFLKICSFDIIDQVRHEENAFTMARAFIERMKFDRRDAFHIGEYIEKLGKEIDDETMDIFVDMVQQCEDITFDHIDLLLDGLTKIGTDFEVFRKLPRLYDIFYCKVDIYQNTLFHHIVAIYSVKEKYKLYIQHFCENKFSMLQIRNMEGHSAIDFASYLGRTECIAIVVCNIKAGSQPILDGILQMATSGLNTLQKQNNTRLINISLPNIAYGKRDDYTNIFQLIGKEPGITSNDDNNEDAGCGVSSSYHSDEDDVYMDRETFVDPINELLSLLLPAELIEILRSVNN